MISYMCKGPCRSFSHAVIGPFVGHTQAHTHQKSVWMMRSIVLWYVIQGIFLFCKGISAFNFTKKFLSIEFFSTARVKFSWMNSCVEIDFSWSCYASTLLLLTKMMMSIPVNVRICIMRIAYTNGMLMNCVAAWVSTTLQILADSP